MAKDLKQFQRMIRKGVRVMPDKVPRIIGAEGLKFIAQNFRDQGFRDTSLKKWKDRKTKDDRGRDLTRYRTNRTGRAGALNRYGSKIKDRAILVGHNTGGDKLKNSFKMKATRKSVSFYTYKPYAERHNEGLEGMPQRQFMGKSQHLDKAIKKKLTKELNKVFKRR